MLFEKLHQHVEGLSFSSIPEDRKAILNTLKDQLAKAIKENGVADLNFICTHNSRRSHLSQVWAQVAAAYHGFGKEVRCYSGGTEATALYPAVAETLAGSGLLVTVLSQGENPVYAIKYGANEPAVIGFSKAYHHEFNPSSNFIAVMTCSQADEGCPLVIGASSRVPLTFEDPKLFDHTPEKMAKYQERSLQIASELFWMFKELKNTLSK